jgi:hypothetical protein
METYMASLGYEHYDARLPVSGVPARLVDQAKASVSIAGVSLRLPHSGRSR